MAKKKIPDESKEVSAPEIHDDVAEAEEVSEDVLKNETDDAEPEAASGEVAAEPDVSDEIDEADQEPFDAESDNDIETDTDEHDLDHDEADHHVSVAARSLQILAILTVGAVIGIWAAPRVAPLLPAGMAPVAQWLSPSNNAAVEDVEELRLELEARIDVLETNPNRTEIETRLANFQTDTVNPVRAQMTALSDQVAAADSTAVESRLWALEGRVEGLIVEIESLTSSLGDIAAEGGAISADTAATISAYRSRIDGLQASLDEMSSLQGALSQRIDEVAATAERQVAEAETLVAEATEETAQTLSVTEIKTAITQINAALRTGIPFAAPLERIAANTEQPVPAALLAAQDGVQTLETLQTSFVNAAHNAIRASIADQSQAGLLGSFGSFVKSQVATRSLTPQTGDSTDAILSRMEAALQRGALNEVLSESQSLSDKAMVEMSRWLQNLTTRRDVIAALDTLDADLGLEE